MKNVLKTLGIMCIIGAALFIMACPPGEPVEETYTVTFMNGSTVFSTVTDRSEGDTVDKPDPDPAAAPTPVEPKTAGLWKFTPGTGTAAFSGWTLTQGSTELYTAWPLTVNGNQTLYAVWTGVDTWAPVELTDVSLGGVAAAIGSPAADTKFLWVVTEHITSGRGVFDKANTDLKITAPVGQRRIKSTHTAKSTVTTGSTAPNNDGVFLLIGATTNTPSITVTVDNILLEGLAGFGSDNKANAANTDNTQNDSLVRVQNGATLILDRGSAIRGHISNDTAGSGRNGNGSAVCVYNGGKLNIKDAIIRSNRSTGEPNPNNKNRVGGLYAIGTSGAPAIVELGNARIQDNESMHTNDIYITEYVTFTMAVASGMTIGDFTINSESNATDTAIPSGQTVSTTILIPSAVEKDITLNLRTTGSLAQARTNWTNQVVLQGTTEYSLTQNDVNRFKLGQFRGNSTLTETGDAIAIEKLNFELKLENNTAKLVTK